MANCDTSDDDNIDVHDNMDTELTIDQSADNSLLNITNEFIILDVSKSFKTDNPLWVVNNHSTNPNLFNHGVTSGGNDLMILFGGVSDTTSNPNSSILWYCHTDDSKILQPSTINKDKISNRILFGGMTPMSSDSNNSYIFGGTDPLTLSAVISSQEIISIGISSIESDIAISSYISANVTSYDHTVTLLDGKIYVIGGIHYFNVNSGSYVDMSSIGVYNTKDSTWNTVVSIISYATGTLPDMRDTNSLFKLNVLSLTWEKLSITGPDPGSRYGHTFTLVGNYIIGTYGLSKTSDLQSIPQHHQHQPYQQQHQPYQQQQQRQPYQPYQPYQQRTNQPYQQYVEEEVDPLNYDTTKIPFGHPKNRQGSVGSDPSKANNTYNISSSSSPRNLSPSHSSPPSPVLDKLSLYNITQFSSFHHIVPSPPPATASSSSSTLSPSNFVPPIPRPLSVTPSVSSPTLRSTSRMSDISNPTTRSNRDSIIGQIRSGSLSRTIASASPTGIRDDNDNITGGGGRLFSSNIDLDYESD
ncbi:2245_t:CDS:10 [Diversispora eburnea]|uniref:2245_t:CDS:1 n=1 Tax=Diversispora eburnea TaxID=1213867 RepID=A0A9N8ZY11_9GLOM|nr:2245_t:CDS:10 [Diversispora eburnea]